MRPPAFTDSSPPAIVLKVIEAARSGSSGLLPLMQFEAIPCVATADRKQDERLPLCGDSDPSGTLYDAVPSSACEPGFLTRDNAPLVFDRLFSGNPSRLAAAAITSRPQTEPYVLVFDERPSSAAFAFYLNDAGIVRFERSCGYSADGLLVDDAGRPLLRYRLPTNGTP